jgi:hypothetical protein
MWRHPAVASPICNGLLSEADATVLPKRLQAATHGRSRRVVQEPFQYAGHAILRGLPLMLKCMAAACHLSICLVGGSVLSAPEVPGNNLTRGEHVPATAPHTHQLQHLLAEKQAWEVSGVRDLWSEQPSLWVSRSRGARTRHCISQPK